LAVELIAEDSNTRRSFDSNASVVLANADQGDEDTITDANTFIDLARQDEHA
jgi:hypothetical protein